MAENSPRSSVRLALNFSEALAKHRAQIQKQLEKLDRATALLAGAKVGRDKGRGSALRGRKPKYRGLSGATWAGRAAKPRWIVDAIKGGKKLENFLIEKSGAKGSKKRRSKR